MTYRANPRTPRPFRVASIVAAIFIAASVASSGAAATIDVTVSPIPAYPSLGSVQGWLQTWVNADRASLGLAPLRLDGRLRAIADGRAATMAGMGVLTHTAAGDLSSELSGAGVQWYGWGEDIGWTTFPWGVDAARSLYTMWKHSPEHWTLLMSPSFNYVGFGLGYRTTDRSTYGSVVFSESRDQTPPAVRMTSATRTGSTVQFSWTGVDVRLQTHTSGFRSFDLLYRASGGTWRIIRSGTTSTSISIASRPSGHSYYLSVRARDNAGNLSAWSAPLHIWVP